MSIIIFSQGQPTDIDGFLYLHAAAEYTKGGVASAYAVYPWPFFPLLMAEIQKFSGLSLWASAYVVVVLLDVLIVLSFTLLIQILYKKPHFVWLGLLTILCFKSYNQLRDDILRDHGYWAFTLLAIVCLVKLAQTQQWRYGLTWGFLISIATLFRIEGGILLLLAPLSMCLLPKTPWKTRFKLVFQSQWVFLLIVIALLTYFSTHHGTYQLGRLAEIKNVLLHPASRFFTPFQEAVLKMQQYVLLPSAKGSASTLLLSGSVGIIFLVFINTISLFYGLMALYAIFYKLLPSRSNNYLLYGILILNLLISFFFIIQNFFLSERYIIMLCLIAMLWIPGTVDHIYSLWRDKNSSKRWLLPFLCAGFLYLAIGSLFHFGPSKTYLSEAANWLRSHTTENSVIISNEIRICYLARKSIENDKNIFCIGDQVKAKMHQKLIELKLQDNKQPIYVAININHNSSDKEFIPDELANLSHLIVFKNRRGDKLLIFTY